MSLSVCEMLRMSVCVCICRLVDMVGCGGADLLLVHFQHCLLALPRIPLP